MGRHIAIEEGKWNAKKELFDNFENMEIMLTQVFEELINAAYHTGMTRMGQKGYGNLSPYKIIFCLWPEQQEGDSVGGDTNVLWWSGMTFWLCCSLVI